MRKIEAGITDIFSSVQGEGIFVGAKQIFVRFEKCNMACSFCDEQKNVKPRMYTPAALISAVGSLEGAKGFCHSVSLTGGEPLLHFEFLNAFLPLLHKKGMKVYLETNGTLPEALAKVIKQVDIVSMDFKLPSSTGCRAYWNEHYKFLKIACRKNVFVKVVVTSTTTDAEIKKASDLVRKVGKNIPFILQPVTPVKRGDKEIPSEKLLRFLEIGLKNDLDNIRVIPQVHKMLNLK